MLYEYKCQKCNVVQDIELDIEGLLPKEILCRIEGCDGVMTRVWSINVAIPDHMKATTDNTINYEKRNQVHKKHFGRYGNF